MAANEPFEGYQADAERNGRLLKKALKKAVKRVDDDLVDAAEELGTEIFSLMNEFRVPKAVHITVLAALLAVPLIGPLLKIIQPKTKEENHGDTSHDLSGS